MNTITPKVTPSFGMAVKFSKNGRNFYEKVFEHNPAAGDEFIKRQAGNLASNIYISGSGNVSVDIKSRKYKIMGDIRLLENSAEEILLVREGNLFRSQDIKTIICPSKVPFAEKYGENGYKLAAAECIANFENKVGRKKYGIAEKLISILTND